VVIARWVEGPRMDGRMVGLPMPLIPDGTSVHRDWSDSRVGITGEVTHPVLPPQDRAMYFANTVGWYG